jgi:hypothetical protein
LPPDQQGEGEKPRDQGRRPGALDPGFESRTLEVGIHRRLDAGDRERDQDRAGQRVQNQLDPGRDVREVQEERGVVERRVSDEQTNDRADRGHADRGAEIQSEEEEE